MSIAASHELTPEASDRRPGRMILLNGTSSSGKSSIAKELLATLDGTWCHLGVDQFHHVRARRDDWTDPTFLPVFQRTVLGFHRAVAGMASAGNDVVVDHVLGERWRLADCLTIFDGFPVLFVGVRCALPERRERERGNRTVGRAAVQFPLVHQHGIYDLEVDSERQTPAECASLIRNRLNDAPTSRLQPTTLKPPLRAVLTNDEVRDCCSATVLRHPVQGHHQQHLHKTPTATAATATPAYRSLPTPDS